MTTTYYGPAAYQAVGRAIGMQLGLKVEVRPGANACIDDQGVIYLPGMTTYQTREQFDQTCGVLVHELAHQHYGTNKWFAAECAKRQGDRLWALCLNAVMDIADETWIDQWFSLRGNDNPGKMLTTKSKQSAQQPQLHQWEKRPNLNGHEAWRVLVVMMLNIRGIVLPKIRVFTSISGKGRVTSMESYTVAKAKEYGVEAVKVHRLLTKARKAKGKFIGPNKPRPKDSADPGKRNAASFKFWRDMLAITDEIAALLRPFEPPAGQAPEPEPIIVVIGQGSANLPQGGTEATGQEAVEVIVNGKGQPQPGQQQQQVPSRQQPEPPGFRKHDGKSYHDFAPSVRRVSHRIATDGDGMTRHSGLLAGTRMAEPHRMHTDGKCMGRWQVSEHADGMAVAVVLDMSGSMRPMRTECAGVARAFVMQMRECAAVKAFEFGDKVRESKNDYDTVEDMGFTATHLAMAEALKWLRSVRAGRKWIVCITDGMPDSEKDTTVQMRRAMQDRVKVLAVGIGRADPKKIGRSMAGARMLTAGDARGLAVQLDRATRLIEA